MPIPARYRRCYERRPRFTALATVALAVFLAIPFADALLRDLGVASEFGYYDFGAYRDAVQRWEAGEALYVPDEEGDYHGAFLYPPVTVLLFWPFVEYFPVIERAQVWNALSVALLWLSLQLVVRELGYRLRWYERLLLLWALLGFHPLLISMKLGQTAGFLGALLSLAFVGLARRERVRSEDSPGSEDGRFGRLAGVLGGALTAVVGIFKLAYAPVGAHLLASRRRLFAAVATAIAMLGLSVAVFGIESHLTYVDVLAWGVASGEEARAPWLWLPPYFRPLSWLPGATLLRLVGSALVVLVVLQSDADDAAIYALGVAAFPLLTPLAYTYYLVALLPAALVLLAGELRRGDGRPTLVVLGLLLANLHAWGFGAIVEGLPAVVPTTATFEPVYFLLQPGAWGTAMLAAIAFYRVLQGVPDESLLHRVVGRLDPA